MTAPKAAPGRVLVVGTNSGWREWHTGELVLPHPQRITGHDPQDQGIISDVQVWSIRDPRLAEQEDSR